MRRLIALAIAGLWSAAPAGQQVAPSQAEEAAVVEQARTALRFENDGTGRRESYMRVKVQSEAGVQQWGQVVIGYNAATERLEIPFVRVRKADGTVVETPPQSVQELSSPVERIAPVYTDFRQKHVTVQSLRPGDTLEFSVVMTIHTALAPGQFWAEYTFNDDAIVLDEQLDIDLPAARRIILKVRPGVDPAVKEADGRRRYHWVHAHAVRTDEKDVKEEKPGAKSAKKRSDEPERAPVRLTTFADWKEVGSWFAGLERVARAPAPASEVLRDAYGDCKDKHTLLAALIDAAGLQASAVLINSQIKIDPEFPSPSQFDHVITRAHVAGQDVWLDSTPEVAPFRMLSYALRKKQALVTETGAGSHLEETPADGPWPSLMATDVEGTLNDAGTLAANVRMTFRGDGELVLRTVFRATPSPQWKDVLDALVKQAELVASVSDLHVSDPQATLAPLTLTFHIEAERFAEVAGRTMDLPMPLSAESKGDLPEPPESGPIALGATGDVVRRVLNVKQRELPEGRRSDYVAFGHVLTADARQHVSVDGTAMAAVELSADAKGKELSRSGYEALQAGDYEKAAALLKRAAEADPKQPSIWLNLGMALLSLRQPEAALDALRKQIELNPFSEYAYFYLGRAYLAQRKYADAEAAFTKELEINPLDKYAPAGLGGLYMEQRQYEKAAEAFEKATAVNPTDASAQVQLGKAYLNLHRNRDATGAFDRVRPRGSALAHADDVERGRVRVVTG